MITGGIHKCAGKHSHVSDIQMLNRHAVGCRRTVIRIQPLVLVKQMKHLFHGFQRLIQPLSLFLRAAFSKPLQNLFSGHGIHHLIQHNIRRAKNTVLSVKIPVDLIVFLHGILVKLFMKLFQILRLLFQLLHIGIDSCFPFSLIRNAIQIEDGFFGSSADSHGITVGTVISRILNIKRSSAFKGQALYRRHCDFVSSHLQRRHIYSHGARFRMILRGNQPQAGIGSGLQLIVSDINDKLFSFIGGYSQRLPCIQASEAKMAVLRRRNCRVNLYHFTQLSIQQTLRIIQFLLKSRSFGMEFPAFFIFCIQTFLQLIYGIFRYVSLQHRMQIICIQRQNVVLQTVIIIEIDLCNNDIMIVPRPGEAQTDFVGGYGLGQFNCIISSSFRIGFLQKAYPLSCRTVRMSFVIIIDIYSIVISQILCFGEGNIVHFVVIIQLKQQSFIRAGVGSAVIPVKNLVIGAVVLIRHAQSAVFAAFVQTASHHASASMGDR